MDSYDAYNAYRQRTEWREEQQREADLRERDRTNEMVRGALRRQAEQRG